MTTRRNSSSDRESNSELPENVSIKLQHSIQRATQGIALLDHHADIIFSNTKFSQLFEIQGQDSLIGKNFDLLMGEILPSVRRQDTAPKFSDLDVSVVRQSESKMLRISISADTGRYRLALIESFPTALEANSDGSTADTDHLTGLGNRLRYQQALAEWSPGGSDASALAVLMIDLDRFKNVNDTLGHGAGDELLKIVASRLRAASREEDVLIRVGGDEFAILHTTGFQPDGAESVANRVVDLMSRPFLVQGHQVNIGASVGISVLNVTTRDRDDLLKHADLALYDAKASGKGTHRLFSNALADAAEFRRSIEIDLRRAVGLKEMELVYQPQLDIGGKKIIGFEALIRWNHPTRGVVPPLDFIPLAEEIGEIHTIGDWVLRTACAEARNWPGDLTIAINVSALQFEKETFVERISNALKVNELAPSRLELEITESVLMSQSKEVRSRLWEIKDMGISVAMDDFGTGYSSLSYLNSFPFSKIKIDQSFVRGEQTSKTKALVSAILSLGKALDMTTIAEGVETSAQLDELASQGCMEGQGYFIGKPMPADTIEHYLATYTQ